MHLRLECPSSLGGLDGADSPLEPPVHVSPNRSAATCSGRRLRLHPWQFASARCAPVVRVDVFAASWWRL